jgi:hypothetical protein
MGMENLLLLLKMNILEIGALVNLQDLGKKFSIMVIFTVDIGSRMLFEEKEK